MSRRPWGSARDMVAAYTKAHPGARPCDIAEALNLLPEYVSTAMRRLKRHRPTRQSRKLLHAAAPDLLEACRVAATAELYDPSTGIIDADVLRIVQDIARAAISKAEGSALQASGGEK